MKEGGKGYWMYTVPT